jgi:arylsulfatase
MVEIWWREAEKHGVLPLDDRGAFDLFRASRRPGMPTSRNRFVYYPPLSHIVADACPPVFRGWRMTFSLDHPKGNGDGVLVARGNINSGYVLYIENGQLHFDFNCFHDHTLVSSTLPVPTGAHEISAEISPNLEGGAAVALRFDGEEAGHGTIPKMLFMISSIGMDFGRSPAPVSNAYDAPFAYPGRISRVTFDLPPRKRDKDAREAADKADEAQVRAALSRQ